MAEFDPTEFGGVEMVPSSEKTFDPAEFGGVAAAPTPSVEETSWDYEKMLRNVHKNEWVKKDEIEAIAAKHKVEPEYIGAVIDLANGARELMPEEKDVLGYLKGVGRRALSIPDSIAGGALTKAWRQYAHDEAHQRAADEAIALADEKKNYLVKAGEMGIQFLIPGLSGVRAVEKASIPVKLAAIEAEATGLGALAGYGGAKTGEELEGVGTGALIGAAATPALAGTAALGYGAYKAGRAAIEKATETSKAALGKVSEVAGEVSEKLAERRATQYKEADVLYKKGQEKIENIEKEQSDIADNIIRIKSELEKTEDENEREILESSIEALHEKRSTLEEDKLKIFGHTPELTPSTKYDIIVNTDRLYDSNKRTEKEIEDTIVESIALSAKEKGMYEPAETPTNLFIGKFMVKSLFSSDAAGEAAWTKMIDRQMKTGKYSNSIDAEIALSDRVLADEKYRIAKYLDSRSTKSEADTVLKAHLAGAGSGEKGLREAIQALRKREYAIRYINKNKEALADDSKALHMAARYLSPNEALDQIDSKYGQNNLKLLHDAINNDEISGFKSKDIEEESDQLIRSAREVLSFRGSEGGKVAAQIAEAGDLGAETLYKAKLIDADELREGRKIAYMFKRIGELLRSHGLEIPLIKAEDGSPAYFPRIMKSGSEVRSIIVSEFANLKSSLAGKDFTKLSAREKELVDSAAIAAGHSIQSRAQLYDAIVKIKDESPATISRLNNARASMMRSGEGIPDLIREYDVSKVLDSYLTNSFRHLSLREPVRALKNNVEVLKKAGDLGAAKYVDDMVNHLIAGVEKSSISKMIERHKDKYTPQILGLERQKQALVAEIFASEQKRGLIKEKIGEQLRSKHPGIEQIEQKLSKIRFKQELPETLLHFARSSFMAKLLGGSVKAAGRDLWQPYTMSISQIGGKYGAEIMARATADYLTTPVSFRKMRDELIAMGQIGENFAGQLSASRESVDMYNELLKKSRKVADTVARGANVLRTGSEIVNRYTMVLAAKHLASDFLEGVQSKAGKEARKYIDRELSESYRNIIRKAIEDKTINREILTNAIANDLIAKTQFRYHPAMKSEMQRVYGPLFTQFTQYPTGAVSTLVGQYRKHGAAKAASAALSPLAGLMALTALYEFAMDEDTLSPREQVFLYKEGFTGGAPITGVAAMMPGVGPSAKLGQSFLKLLESPEFSEKYGEKVKDYFLELGSSVTPVGIFKKVIEELYALATDEELEWN